MRDSTSASESRSFLQDLEFDYHATDRGLEGTMTLTEEMMAPGSDQASIAVLASVGDVLTGILVSSSDPQTIALTVDLTLRTLAPVPVGRYRTTAMVLKHGRTVSVAEAVVLDDSGAALALCWATFMPITVPGLPELTIPRTRLSSRATLRTGFADALGVRVAHDGVATVERRPYTLQPAGTLQGGVVCALAEEAARFALGAPIDELDVRFLATVRTGPGRAVADVLGPDTARVTVTDAGSASARDTAVALARIRR